MKALFTYKLVSPSGYEAEGEANITPEQYGAICKVIEGIATPAAAAEQPAPWLCIKPQCPPNCDGCNHAVRTGSPQALVARLLNEFANDGHGATFEEGDHPLVDEARQFLATPAAAAEPSEEGIIALAKRFHDTYERLAPAYGYDTRPDTKVFDQYSKNGRLMIATVRAMRLALRTGDKP